MKITHLALSTNISWESNRNDSAKRKEENMLSLKDHSCATA